MDSAKRKKSRSSVHPRPICWRTVIAGTMMIVIGLVMWAAERAGRKNRDIGAVNVIDASLIGLSQALAIVPGTSRSGITISTGLFRNLDRVAAARSNGCW